jgi:hypothetical protein
MSQVHGAGRFARRLRGSRQRNWQATLRLALYLSLLCTYWGCRSIPVDVAAPRVERLEVPVRQVAPLETGRAIYTSVHKCARCHNPKSVTDYTPTQWTENILPRMSQKAKLSQLEREYLTAYVLAACESRRSVISTR